MKDQAMKDQAIKDTSENKQDRNKLKCDKLSFRSVYGKFIDISVKLQTVMTIDIVSIWILDIQENVAQVCIQLNKKRLEKRLSDALQHNISTENFRKASILLSQLENLKKGDSNAKIVFIRNESTTINFGSIGMELVWNRVSEAVGEDLSTCAPENHVFNLIFWSTC